MSSWYNTVGNNSEIIISSRIRLARNLKDFNFPSRMSDTEFAKLNGRLKSAILDSNTPFANSLKYIDMNDVPEVEAFAMVERHIISPEFARRKKNKSIIISEDESICVMVGEEDHIRIQVIKSGLALNEAYDIAERLDTLLCDKLHFAFSSQFGYLTECPTNLGTGLRASVMLHLPMIETTREIPYISESVNKIGFTMRGMYGEGSDSKASLYQLSNQITLGISENDALKNLTTITKQIIEKETLARHNTDIVGLEDNIFRSFGILSNARKIDTEEMMKYLSLIKLGVSMGILDIEKQLPMKIFVECQPNMIIRKYGITNTADRDIKRAEIIRDLLH